MDSNVNRAEHELISTALEIEKLENNLFRSRSLWKPARGRGVFGGYVVNAYVVFANSSSRSRQVISQALVAATNCVDPAFGLHVRIIIMYK